MRIEGSVEARRASLSEMYLKLLLLMMAIANFIVEIENAKITTASAPLMQSKPSQEEDPEIEEDLAPQMTDKQLKEICGKSSEPELQLRIVGGTEAEQDKWPWMVALIPKQLANLTFCGGTLINEYFALTASHCLYAPNTDRLFPDYFFILKVGARDIFDKSHGMSVDVHRLIPHPEYSRYRASNDIGLIKLATKVKFSQTIRPICLPDTPDLIDDDLKYRKPHVVGWGLTNIAGKGSTILREVTVYVAEHRACELLYREFRLLLTDKQFCAGFPRDGMDACKGDSGGPAMDLNSKDQFAIIGVISIGHRCGTATYPTIYTRVASYLPWIKEVAEIV